MHYIVAGRHLKACGVKVKHFYLVVPFHIIKTSIDLTNNTFIKEKLNLFIHFEGRFFYYTGNIILLILVLLDCVEILHQCNHNF